MLLSSQGLWMMVLQLLLHLELFSLYFSSAINFPVSGDAPIGHIGKDFVFSFLIANIF